MPKTVLITGVLGKIGSAISEKFRNEGYYVIGLDRKKALDEPCDRFIQFDINQYIKNVEYRIQFTDIFDKLVLKLDVLINNAEVKFLNKTDDIRLEDWQETLNVNLTGPMLLSRMFLKRLEKNKGSIINIASIHHIQTKKEHVSYTTSKSALIGLTKAMAVDLKGRVRVNAISPSPYKNIDPSTLGRRELEAYERRKTDPTMSSEYPKDVAKLSFFLASESSGVLHGANLTLDGGLGSILENF